MPFFRPTNVRTLERVFQPLMKPQFLKPSSMPFQNYYFFREWARLVRRSHEYVHRHAGLNIHETKRTIVQQLQVWDIGRNTASVIESCSKNLSKKISYRFLKLITRWGVFPHRNYHIYVSGMTFRLWPWGNQNSKLVTRLVSARCFRFSGKIHGMNDITAALFFEAKSCLIQICIFCICRLEKSNNIDHFGWMI